MEFKPIQLSITSNPENLRDIRETISDVTLKSGFSKEDCGGIILAVDEACSNVIKHCCKNDPNKKINITISHEKGCLTISIVDTGTKFDISDIKSRDINEIRPGGLGTHIIKQVMDTVEYSHTPEGLNQLRMTKKLNG